MIELFFCTLIWGSSFIAQKLGADHFGPFSISCYRNLLAAAVLLVGVQIRDRFARGKWTRGVLVGGSLSGVCLFAAMLTQQLGIEKTTPGISAFLTANYMLLVPVFAIVLGRRAGWSVWVGVAMALLGTYFICLSSEASSASQFKLGPGESWTLLCAALFAVQILVVDHFAKSCDMLRFSTVQVAVAGIVALPFVFLPSELARGGWDEFVKGIPSLLWLGVMSSGVAYTLQNMGQAKLPASLASIVMSMEGVFAVFFGWLILGDRMSVSQVFGCSLVLAAVLLSQLLRQRPRSCEAASAGYDVAGS